MEKSFAIGSENSSCQGDHLTMNSTTIREDGDEEIGKRDLTLSPIPHESIANNQSDEEGTCTQRIMTSPTPNSTNSYDSSLFNLNEDQENEPGTSTPEKTPDGRAHRFINPFERHLMEKLHSNTFSPSVFLNVPATPEESRDFKWSIEHLAALRPANITDEEIAKSNYSPDPVQEARYRAVADLYWKSDISIIPSPEGTRPIVMETPLSDIVRLRNASRALTSSRFPSASRPSPIRRPAIARQNSILRKRNTAVQTSCTIGPSVDFDFASILGETSVFTEESCEIGAEFDSQNVSMQSLRRRLFANDDDSFLTEDGSARQSANTSQTFDVDSEDDLQPLPSDSSTRKTKPHFPTSFHIHDVIGDHFVPHRVDLGEPNHALIQGLEFDLSPIKSD